MAIILNIETSTKVCSVALAKNKEVIDLIEHEDDNYSHSEKLNLFILELLEKNNLSFDDLDAVAISEGPGSYTGLRIGVSTAKGICYSKDIPLISVNTLEALCKLVSIEAGYKIPMIDARRMEVFMSVLTKNDEIHQEQTNEIISEDSFETFGDDVLYLFGNGAFKLKKLFSTRSNIHFIDNIKCSAKGMVHIAYQKFLTKDFVDTAYFEPNYGKEFYTTAKKIKSSTLS